MTIFGKIVSVTVIALAAGAQAAEPIEWFRSGCVWQLGKGTVFYFRPGHETFSVYLQKEPLLVIENAVRSLGSER